MKNAIQHHRKLLKQQESVLKESSHLSDSVRKTKLFNCDLSCKHAREQANRLLTDIKSACGKTSIFSHIFSFKNLAALQSFAQNHVRLLVETSLAGSISGILNINMIAPPMLVPLGRMGNYLRKALPLVKATYDAAQKERAELRQSLILSNEPLSHDVQILLDETDSKLETALVSLRNDYLEPLEEAHEKEVEHHRIGPFVPPNDDPATVKWYARINTDLTYYYNHPYQPAQQYRIPGIKISTNC